MPERIREKHKPSQNFDFPSVNNYDENDFDTIFHNSHFVFKTPKNYKSQNDFGSCK